MDNLQARLAARIADRYAIQRELGRGGMATVFLAEDIRLQRPVAVKVLHPELSVTVSADRFLMEIQIAAGLTHPHILPLHDSGQADSLLYYVMPYVAGETLHSLLKREGRLSLPTAERITRQVASALSYAHGRSLVHRDIKPENILLPEGEAVVADFGIARAMGSATRVTMTGMALGSPLYMSPEQAAGDEVDGRSDLYSLGCLLFEMLIGEPPFTGPHALAILAKHATAPLPELAARRPEIGAHLETIVATLLAKDPANRYASARELIDALDRPETGSRLAAARRAAAPSSAPGGAGGSAPVGSIAVLPFVDRSQAGEQAHLCEGIPEDVLVALGRARGIRVAARSSSFRFRGSDVDIRAIGRELTVDTVLSGSVQRAGDRLRINAELSSAADGFQLWSKHFDRQFTDIFAIQDEIASSIAAALRVTLTEDSGGKVVVARHTKNLDAYEEYLRGRQAWNKRHAIGFQQAIASYQKALDLDPLYARPYAGLGDAFCSMGAYGYLPPQTAWARVGEATRRALELEPDLPEAITSLSLARGHFAGEWAEGEAGFRHSLELDPNYSTTPLWLSFTLSALGRHDEAVELGRRAAALEPANPVLPALSAYNMYRARRYDEAIGDLRSSLSMVPGLPVAHAFLGITLMAQERWQAAIPELEAARTFPALPGYLAFALARAGRVDDARRELLALEQSSATAYVPPLGLAMGHLGLGERERALSLLETCAAERTFIFTWGAVDPLLDELRGEARFTEALRSMGLGHVPSPI